MCCILSSLFKGTDDTNYVKEHELFCEEAEFSQKAAEETYIEPPTILDVNYDAEHEVAADETEYIPEEEELSGINVCFILFS